MTNKIPAIVLGGTGYVSGELLRLIVGHPELRARGRDVGQLAGRARGQVVSAPRGRARRYAVQVAGGDRRARSRRSRTSAVFCAAPHGAAAALIDSLLKAAEAAGTKPRFVDISADFRFATAAGYEAVYKHPHGAPHRLAQFTCAVPEHLKSVTDAARRRIRAASPRRSCWPACRCWRPARRAHAVRQRRHRQHRLRPQAGRRHAPSDAPQRPVFLRRARPSPHAGDHRARQGGVGRRRGVRVRAAFGPVRARHPCHRAGAPQVAARRRRRGRAAARVLRGLPVRARARQRAAREGHRREQLRASVRRRPTAARSP